MSPGRARALPPSLCHLPAIPFPIHRHRSYPRIHSSVDPRTTTRDVPPPNPLTMNFRHRLPGPLASILAVLLLHPVAGRGETPPHPAPLRAAIQELSRTWADEYPQGARYLARLDTLEGDLASPDATRRTRAQEELAALQREALLANPLLTRQPLLFVVRPQYKPDHHNTATFFPAAVREYNDGSFTPGGALRILDLRNGERLVTLLETRTGAIRDPEVRYDGHRIVFALRKDPADSYHLHEINADGTGLRQLTFARDVDDFDPVYLPDGGIAFSSTREPKYCMCNRHIMANLHRMDADGANIHQIGRSTLFEGHATVLPDGRLLYDRWEYVDRNFGDAQSLWTVHPDGTGHAIYWGNNTAAPGAVIDARAIPGTDQVLAVFGSCHDRPWGALAILDRNRGLDGPDPVVRLWPPDATKLIRQSGWELFDAFTSVRPKYEDPYPLGPGHFVASRMTGNGEEMGIYLLDLHGNEVLVHREAPGCFDPMPLGPKPRPAPIPVRRTYAGSTGTFYVQDVYEGTHMAGVPRGTVKWLRVVESPEKRYWTRPPWGGQGQSAPAMNWHDFNNKRILGQVPVADDGSAYFEVPAETFVYFQLLDADGMMVQSMRSGALVQPGERAGCVGCHEDRRQAPAPRHFSLAALRQAPSPLTGWHGPAREFNYLAEVQPVFDRHCVVCHDFGTEAGRTLTLAGDRDLVFNASYNELWRKKYVKVVGAGPPETQPAGSWGARASRLVSHLRTTPRCGGRLTSEDWDRLVTWIDLNAPYYPSYASAHPDNLAGRSPLDDTALARLETLTGIPLRQLASHTANRGPQIAFDRPDRSPCLARWTDTSAPDYREALALIERGADRLRAVPEADAPGFAASDIDRWREEKYQARRRAEERSRAALHAGARHYEQVGAEGAPR